MHTIHTPAKRPLSQTVGDDYSILYWLCMV